MSEKPKTEATRPTSGQTEAADTRNTGFKAAAAKGKAALGAKFAADPQPKQSVGIRRVKMTISKVDPLSALKIGFITSVAIGIMIVVAMMILWFVLNNMKVFSQIDDLLQTLNQPDLLRLGEYLEFGRWMSFAVIIAIIDVVLSDGDGGRRGAAVQPHSISRRRPTHNRHRRVAVGSPELRPLPWASTPSIASASSSRTQWPEV